MEAMFWVLVSVVLYVYFGYPALLWILVRFKGKRPVPESNGYEPTVSLIIAAYNEEKAIGRKLENSLSLDYPKDKLEIIVGSDGSTDGTNTITRAFASRGIKLRSLPQNMGKSCVQNAAVHEATGEILVFSDATGLYAEDAVGQLVKDFADPRVGCVAGSIIYSNEDASCTSRGTGLYWRYELWLREKESHIGNLAMASGSVFGVRRVLFEPIDPGVSDDFVLPMVVLRKGYRVVHEPKATSVEEMATNASGELRVKARTVSLDLRGLLLNRELLWPIRYPLVSLGLMSHKLLRWLIPWILIVLVTLNVVLADSAFYFATLGVQLGLYLVALVGCASGKSKPLPLGLGVPYSFLLVNVAAVIGWLRFLEGRPTSRWVPVR